MRARTNPTTALATSSDAVAAASSAGWVPASDRSADMPTEMKKNPSSRPSNGAMSAWSSWRYSDSDSSTPAMNAPSEADRPPAVASRAVPATMSSATAVKTSGVFAPPMARNSGRMRKRPPIRMTAIATAARATSCQGTWSGMLSPPSSGTSATSGMNARSWNSSTAKVSRPAGVVSRSRSASIGRTMAVDDIARPAPSTIAPGHPMPAGMGQCGERGAARSRPAPCRGRRPSAASPRAVAGALPGR